MKNKLNKLLDQNISKKEEDSILEEVIKFKHDKDLKVKWRQKLSNDYGITRTSPQHKIRVLSSRKIQIFLAAACISLLVTVQFFNRSSSNPGDLAQQYLNEQEILHPGATKGIIEENQNRELAIQAFNNKNYAQSVRYFQNLTGDNEEDIYYNGVALLLNGQYKEAIQKFEKINNNDGNRFTEEINWYQSLAYILDKQNEKAKITLKQISKINWNYTKAQELLEKLNKE